MPYEFEKTFAGLYFKDKKIQPDSYETRMDFGSVALRIDYQIGEEKHTDVIELDSALDLLAKRILKAEESLMID